jgi:hypothetical protein
VLRSFIDKTFPLAFKANRERFEILISLAFQGTADVSIEKWFEMMRIDTRQQEGLFDEVYNVYGERVLDTLVFGNEEEIDAVMREALVFLLTRGEALWLSGNIHEAC